MFACEAGQDRHAVKKDVAALLVVALDAAVAVDSVGVDNQILDIHAEARSPEHADVLRDCFRGDVINVVSAVLDEVESSGIESFTSLPSPVPLSIPFPGPAAMLSPSSISMLYDYVRGDVVDVLRALLPAIEDVHDRGR